MAHPVSDYGRAKLEMEQVVLKQDYPVSCLRIGNVAGADQLLENAARLLPEASLVLDRFSDGKSPVRSYIGPATLAQLLNSLAEAVAAGRTLPELMNISAPQPVAMAQLLEAGNINFTYREALPGAIPSVVLATDLLDGIHRFGQNDSAPTEMYRQWQDLRNI